MRLNKVIPELTQYIGEKNLAFPDMLLRIVLFGSYAKGTARINSDIDLALIANRTWDTSDKAEIHTLFDDFDIGAELSFFHTTTSKLDTNSKNNANYWIREEGVELWRRN
jgi:predicted nucleotidyltransferase